MTKNIPDIDANTSKVPLVQSNDDELATTAQDLDEALKAAEDSIGGEDKIAEPLEQGQQTESVEPNEFVEEIESIAPNTEELAQDGIVDDSVMVDAIDDIVAQEADVVLEAEDQSRQLENPVLIANPKSRLRRFMGNSKTRWVIIFVLLIAVFMAGLVPQSRYYLLNNFGVRSSASLSVIDEITRQPLKNVSVRLADKSGITDQDGKVTIEKLKLGSTKVQIEKRAFAIIERQVTIGWGSNPLGEFEAEAVGTQYEFIIKDLLSGKPIKNAEASSGDGNAKADENGKVVLTLDTAKLNDDVQLSIKFSAANFRDEVVKISVNNKESQSVGLVPSRKHVYVSKRSGTYDVYGAYIDGKQEKMLVKGTGLERDDIALIPHQKDQVAALVATRENVRNSEGYLLSTLYILNTSEGALVKIDQSDQIQVIGWDVSGHLVYVKIASGASATDPKRHRLMSFNYKDYSDVKELASANSFNDVVMAASRVYYAQSGAFDDKTSGQMLAINPDGTDKKTILNKEVSAIVRSDYRTLSLKTSEGWYRYTVGASTEAVAGSEPDNQNSRIYTDNPNGQVSIWRDSREGKGVLLSYDKKSDSDTVLTSRSGLNLPMYWLGEKYIIYRIDGGTETADYVLNIDGGEARKIIDVTDSAGIGRWVFY
ncbi:MAG: DUF5050 domain-containing protein [bacterium]|nr:DUF5050 domain-containing protein [bacterium]